MNDALYFITPANYRIEFALFRQIGQITAKRAECRGLNVFFRRFAAFLVRFGRCEIWIEFFKNLVAGAFDIDFKTLQHSRGDAFAFTQKAQQNVFRADIRMIKRFGFLAGERQHFLNTRRIWNVADHLGFRSRADLLLHLHAHGLKVETHLLQDVHGYSLSQFDETQEQMFGADVVVIKAVGLLAGKRQHLLSARCEIIHYSMASAIEPLPDSLAILLISGLGKSFKRSRIIWARRWSRSSAFSFC